MRRACLAIPLLALPAAAFCATHVVAVEGMAFKPATVSVKPGDTVTWENRDVVPHTVTAKGHFDSGALAPGAHWSWRAAGTGRQGYVCTYHPGMAGAVVVAP